MKAKCDEYSKRQAKVPLSPPSAITGSISAQPYDFRCTWKLPRCWPSPKKSLSKLWNGAAASRSSHSHDTHTFCAHTWYPSSMECSIVLNVTYYLSCGSWCLRNLHIESHKAGVDCFIAEVKMLSVIRYMTKMFRHFKKWLITQSDCNIFTACKRRIASGLILLVWG